MPLKIAVPNKGRLMEETLELLRDVGVRVPRQTDRTLIATTNGADNFKELEALRADVFGPQRDEMGSASFSLESGRPYLERHFKDVAVHPGTDILRVTDAQDVVNFIRSYPPGDTATEDQIKHLDAELAQRMAAQGNVFPITRTPGYMVARNPR